MTWLLISIGGVLGTLGRYFASIFLSRFSKQGKIPIGALIINWVGSFFLGVLLGQYPNLDETMTSLLVVGFLGSFTTFSTFSLEAYQLYEQTKVLAFYYSVLSLVGSCLMFLTGLKLF